MKKEQAKRVIAKELKDLDISSGCEAFALIFEQALSASEVLTIRELKKYVEEYAESLPSNLFQ